jgi:intermembrane space import and assembly protein 40
LQFSLEEKARQALECDCVAELRDGPCGTQFSEAFFCFLTSTAEEQVRRGCSTTITN